MYSGKECSIDFLPLFMYTTQVLPTIITRDIEMIMFSPCMFVCLFVCVYACHDVCPGYLAMEDWCHTNNILQAHSWRWIVGQAMLRSVMTSSRSPGHKVRQILKLMYLRQYTARSSIKGSKYLKCLWLSCWHIQLPVSLPVIQMVVATSKWQPFWNCWHQTWKHRPNLCQKNVFHCDDVINDVTWWHENCSLYPCLWEVDSWSKIARAISRQ